jgi:hypothetical protein
MERIAIDLGGRESQLCIRNADGSVITERRCETEKLGDYLMARPKSRVVMETCAESFAWQSRRSRRDTRSGSCRQHWCALWAWEPVG